MFRIISKQFKENAKTWMVDMFGTLWQICIHEKLDYGFNISEHEVYLELSLINIDFCLNKLPLFGQQFPAVRNTEVCKVVKYLGTFVQSKL